MQRISNKKASKHLLVSHFNIVISPIGRIIEKRCFEQRKSIGKSNPKADYVASWFVFTKGEARKPLLVT